MLLELRNISKRFGGISALRDGNLSVEAGQVHLLMGENGAGKSTLMKIVAGMISADSGQLLWKGNPVSFRRPADAAAMGIAMVHQESLLAPHLTIAENIFLGRAPQLGWGIVHRRKMVDQAKRLIADHGFPLQPEWRVERLSPAGKQMVEICRAIQHGSSLLIFDEPTSSLSEAETGEVFRIVRTLRDRQVGVIYITHRLEELRTVGDRVTVLRDGETVHTCALVDLPKAELIRHMVGREMNAIYHRAALPPGKELLTVSGLRAGILRDVSFSLREGEIVGMAGLVGAGRTELCRAIFGLDRVEAGTVTVEGRSVRIHSPRDAVAAGIALVPEDRQHAGLARGLSVGHNITLANLSAVTRWGFLRRDLERGVIRQNVARLQIKVDSGDQLAGRLSGGNQQKVVIAKWLVRGARVFLFDEPTRGIDVGAKVEVFETMDQLARSGAAILMVSSELPELIQVADRILVMARGRITGQLPGDATQEEIMKLATPAVGEAA